MANEVLSTGHKELVKRVIVAQGNTFIKDLASLVPRVCPLIVRDAEYLSSIEKLLEFLLSIFHLGISAGKEVAS